jgi:hypothetical protein
MGRTGSGKSHPISKSLQTNAGPGSMKIEPGLFVFASPFFFLHLKKPRCSLIRFDQCQSIE